MAVGLLCGNTASMAQLPWTWRSTADLFHGSLGSMGQLCKAFPSLWGQGVHLFMANIACVGRGGLLRGGCGPAVWQYSMALTSMDMEITADLFHGSLGSMGQLCKAFPSLWRPRGPPPSWQYSVLAGGGSQGWLWACCVRQYMAWHRFHGHGDHC